MNTTTTPLVQALARALALSRLPVFREPRIREEIPAHLGQAAVIAEAIGSDADLQALVLAQISTEQLHREVVARLAAEHPIEQAPMPDLLAVAV